MNRWEKPSLNLHVMLNQVNHNPLLGFSVKLESCSNSLHIDCIKQKRGIPT